MGTGDMFCGMMCGLFGGDCATGQTCSDAIQGVCVWPGETSGKQFSVVEREFKATDIDCTTAVCESQCSCSLDRCASEIDAAWQSPTALHHRAALWPAHAVTMPACSSALQQAHPSRPCQWPIASTPTAVPPVFPFELSDSSDQVAACSVHAGFGFFFVAMSC